MEIRTKKVKVCSPNEVVAIMFKILQSEDENDQLKEHLWVVGLNSRNQVQYIELATMGLLTHTLFHPREVFRLAILKQVNGVILCHNHPSGGCEPSKQDIDMTKRLCKAGKILGIKVLDHIIINLQGSFSSLGEVRKRQRKRTC